MTTQISKTSQTNVTNRMTAARVTPEPARPFKSVLNSGTAAARAGVEAVAQRLPGGDIIATAVRDSNGLPVGGGAAGVAAATGGGVGGASALGGDVQGGNGSTAIEGVIGKGQDQAMYFLKIQQMMQQENRTFTTMSNVIKSRHDTVKNAIGNVR